MKSTEMSKRIFALTALTALVGCVPDSNKKAEPFEVVEIDTANNQDSTATDIVDDNNVVVERPNPPVVDEAILLECASELVTHTGKYYGVTVRTAGDESVVEITAINLGNGDLAEASDEVVSNQTVPSTLVDGFFGFETDREYMVVEAAEIRGLYRGSMSGETDFETQIPLTCWSAELAVPAMYQASAGGCVDDAGDAATNELPFMYAVHTGFGQCARFEGQLNGEAFGYPEFSGLDLRGADLSAAALNFAHLLDARLDGANLSTFSFGYSTVSGEIDANTVLPQSTFCAEAASAGRYECTQ